MEPGLRAKQEEVEAEGARVIRATRGDVALHSVPLCAAADTQLCPNSFKHNLSLLGLLQRGHGS